MTQTEFLERAMEILSKLEEKELEALRLAIGAELMERDLNGRGNDAESAAESRGTPGGQSTRLPPANPKYGQMSGVSTPAPRGSGKRLRWPAGSAEAEAGRRRCWTESSMIARLASVGDGSS